MTQEKLVNKRLIIKKLILELSAIFIALVMTLYVVGKSYTDTSREQSLIIEDGFVQYDTSQYHPSMENKPEDKVYDNSKVLITK